VRQNCKISIWLRAEYGDWWSLGRARCFSEAAHREEALAKIALNDSDERVRLNHIRGGDIAENGRRGAAYRGLRRAEQCGKRSNVRVP
jgi:hypothetical protein